MLKLHVIGDHTVTTVLWPERSRPVLRLAEAAGSGCLRRCRPCTIAVSRRHRQVIVLTREPGCKASMQVMLGEVCSRLLLVDNTDQLAQARLVSVCKIISCSCTSHNPADIRSSY